MCFLSVLGRIRGFFILTRDLEKKRKFFSLVLGKIREVSLLFIADDSDIALWRISTGRRHHLLYYSSGAAWLRKLLKFKQRTQTTFKQWLHGKARWPVDKQTCFTKFCPHSLNGSAKKTMFLFHGIFPSRLSLNARTKFSAKRFSFIFLIATFSLSSAS